MAEVVGRSRLIKSLIAPLMGDKRIVLHGPIGIGKSTILLEVERQLRDVGYPCGLAPTTATLGDITRALLQVYPDVNVAEWSQRRIRSHLKLAAEDQAGVLLLDHFQDIGTASKGFLKSLWTLKVGILAAVDVEFPRDMQRFRSIKMTDEKIAVPRLDAESMWLIFESAAQTRPLPRSPDEKEWRALLRAAKGRPGWIKLMGLKAGDARYWSEGRLLTGLLRIDVSSEIAGQYLGGALPEFGACASAAAAEVEKGPC